MENAPERAVEVGCVNLQLFTKQPQRWADPSLDENTVLAFVGARETHGIRVAVAHDSYLINLASPDSELWERSTRSFEAELRRSSALGLDFVVTHPGNATDRDYESALDRNADGLTRALESLDGGDVETAVLLETTAGSGTSIGATFERLAAIRSRIPHELSDRVGVCFDTCHAFAAGYDLVDDWDDVWMRFADVIGLDRLRLFHVNDSKHPLGSQRDRHEHLGQGALGEDPFRRLMTDDRFAEVPKLLETPKEGDASTHDVMNLEFLRRLRREA